MVLTRDSYIAALEKRATSDLPNYMVDNRAVAQEEHRTNQSDSRGQLVELFSNAKNVEKGDSKLMSKLWPAKGEKDTSNPLIKVARSAFHKAIQDTAFFKTASAHYMGVALRSFEDELEKIGLSAAGLLL